MLDGAVSSAGFFAHADEVQYLGFRVHACVCMNVCASRCVYYVCGYRRCFQDPELGSASATVSRQQLPAVGQAATPLKH